jgi:drug/metabolite transporter (DMT)-like permease
MNANPSRKPIKWGILALFALLLLWDTTAQLFFKLGANALGEFPMDSFAAVVHYTGQLATNGNVLLGAGSLLLAFFTWLVIIAQIDLSKAHPISSLVYGTVALASTLILQEPFTLRQGLGVLLIMIGAYITSEHDYR